MSFSTALSSIAFASSFVHGRIYQTIDDVRAAIGGFVACYNAEWLIEKNGLRSPREARATRNQALMKVAA
jgi:putative transposase